MKFFYISLLVATKLMRILATVPDSADRACSNWAKYQINTKTKQICF